jgi:protein O-GlcNAc transferase
MHHILRCLSFNSFLKCAYDVAAFTFPWALICSVAKGNLAELKTPEIILDHALQRASRYHQLGDLVQAEALYRQILAQQPNHAETLHRLGILAGQVGQFDSAVKLLKRAIEIQPNNPSYYCNLAKFLTDKGEFDDAVTSCSQAIHLRADFAEAHYNLGAALHAKRNFEGAISSYRQALKFKPDLALAHSNLGDALYAQGFLDDAIASFARAVQLKPDLSGTYNNLGNCLKDAGRLDEAIGAHQTALRYNPNFPESYNNLGTALHAKELLNEAIDAYRTALRLKPDFAVAFNNLGNCLKDAGRLDEALSCFHKALVLQPNYADAYNNLGNCQKDAGQISEAIASYRQAMALCPDHAMAHSNLIYALHFLAEGDEQVISEEHRRWNEHHAHRFRSSIRPDMNVRHTNRRLRIGYVSPDFHHQAECFFIVPLLEAHNHDEFEIHCYASVVRPDQITERLRRAADVWHDVLGESDEQLAERIRKDEIDILVDLTMHMGNNRLHMFARKPAPVQVTWLAYPGSTGLKSIDYRLTDAYMDPLDGDVTAYSEQSIRLPDTWICYDPLTEIFPGSITPTPQASSADQTRFGSLNNPCKLNEAVLQLWTKILLEVPNSTLTLLTFAQNHRNRIYEAFKKGGVDPDRIEFIGRCKRDEYLKLYDQIDLCLDTWPYNGITTSCDALWMGVPVISLVGKIARCRAGLSILSNVGLDELAVQTQEEYLRLAIDLSHDRSHLAVLRSTLRLRLQSSPVMNSPRFARAVEAAFRQIYKLE